MLTESPINSPTFHSVRCIDSVFWPDAMRTRSPAIHRLSPALHARPVTFNQQFYIFSVLVAPPTNQKIDGVFLYHKFFRHECPDLHALSFEPLRVDVVPLTRHRCRQGHQKRRRTLRTYQSNMSQPYWTPPHYAPADCPLWWADRRTLNLWPSTLIDPPSQTPSSHLFRLVSGFRW